MRKVLETLICPVCLARHHVSLEKIQGKKGKFQCKSCHTWNLFRYDPNLTVQKEPVILFDLQFQERLPSHTLQGQLLHQFTSTVGVEVSDTETVFLANQEGNEKDARLRILGLPPIAEWQNLKVNQKFGDEENGISVFLNGVDLSPNQGLLRFEVTQISPYEVQGRIYLAFRDSWNTFLHGSFRGKRIYRLQFDAFGNTESFLPQFLPPFTMAKIFALAGNIVRLQEVYPNVSDSDRNRLFSVIWNHWPLQSGSTTEVHIKEDNIHVSFLIQERKLYETVLFLLSNGLELQDDHWTKIQSIFCASGSEPIFTSVLTKKFPDLASRYLTNPNPDIKIDRYYDWMKEDEPSTLDAFLRKVGTLDYILKDPEENPLEFPILQEAFCRSKVRICLRLLERGANPNLRDLNGETAIFKLCQDNVLNLSQKISLLEELLRRGAKVNIQSTNGMTALHWCSIFGEPSLAKRLIQSGINIHIGDVHGNTALFEACKFGSSSVLALLLENGAKPNEKNNDGLTGRDIAFSELEIAELESDSDKKAKFQRILSLLDVYGG